jgi:uncharacterized protein YkwD
MSFWNQILDWWRGPRRPQPRPTTPTQPRPTTPPLKPPPTTGKPIPPQSGPAAWLTLLLTLHNHERTRAGLRPYNRHDKLEACAMRYATILAAYGRMDSSAHSVDGTSVGGRIAAQGYSWQRAGENVAAGQPTPEAVTQAWMTSPGHRQNILGPFPEVGFGFARATNGAIYWCTVFAQAMGARLLDQALIVQGFGEEVIWEPPGLDARTQGDLYGEERIDL